MRGRPLKFETPEEMQAVIDKYFADNVGKCYTMSGLGLALDMSRMSVVNYRRKEKFGDILAKAKAIVEESWEKELLTPKISSGVVFNLKNNFGWRDQIDIGGEQKHEHRFPKLTAEEAENARKAFDEDF